MRQLVSPGRRRRLLRRRGQRAVGLAHRRTVRAVRPRAWYGNAFRDNRVIGRSMQFHGGHGFRLVIVTIICKRPNARKPKRVASILSDGDLHSVRLTIDVCPGKPKRNCIPSDFSKGRSRRLRAGPCHCLRKSATKIAGSNWCDCKYFNLYSSRHAQRRAELRGNYQFSPKCVEFDVTEIAGQRIDNCRLTRSIRNQNVRHLSPKRAVSYNTTARQ